MNLTTDASGQAAMTPTTDARAVTVSPGARAWLLVGLIAMPLAVSAMMLISASKAPAAAPLPRIAPAPAFTLTERSGAAVSHEDLLGHVWVADFIFTTCAGPCPELTLRMRSLQESLEGRDGVSLVTFTVDPTYDTPEVLQKYAKRYHADPARWLFLTGTDEGAIQSMIQKGFLQTVIPASHEGPIIHSTYLVLVDRAGQIRGFYEGLDPATKPRLLGDIDTLLDEPFER